jgi:hypothetical protein
MIPIEKLKQVRTIVTHKDCPDGIASAILLHDALPNAEVKFLTHGEKAYAELPAKDWMLFCDIAPPQPRAHEFLPRVPIVLDHHKGAEHLVKSFTHHVFADEKLEPGVSGAVLAFREVWEPLRKQNLPHVHDHRFHRAKGFAEMAGIRDTWQSDHMLFGLSSEQAEALRFWPVEQWLGIVDPFDGTDMANMLNIGRALWAKKLDAAQRAIGKAWRVSTSSSKPIRCVIFEGTHLTSDAAEIIGEEADLIIGFGFSVEENWHQLHVSMRSHTDVNCFALAKTFGGGGHTKAAGYTTKFLFEEAMNPYNEVLAHVYCGERNSLLRP